MAAACRVVCCDPIDARIGAELQPANARDATVACNSRVALRDVMAAIKERKTHFIGLPLTQSSQIATARSAPPEPQLRTIFRSLRNVGNCKRENCTHVRMPGTFLPLVCA